MTAIQILPVGSLPTLRTSTRGTAEQWEHAQAAMKTILDDLGVDYDIGIDEVVLMVQSSTFSTRTFTARKTSLVTIQIDMLLAERFGMYYVDKDGQKLSRHSQNFAAALAACQ